MQHRKDGQKEGAGRVRAIGPDPVVGGRAGAVIVALALIAMFSFVSGSEDSAPTLGLMDLPSVAPAQSTPPTLSSDRDRILELIRDHRHQTDEPWRAHLADAIHDEAVAASVDPLLVAAIVARESSFRSRVVSSAGAVGLMQLRPFVAESVAEKAAIRWDGTHTLNEPALNVRLGILYFKELSDRFDGDERMALTAYNYGPTRVRRDVRKGVYRGSRYADEILRDYATLQADRGRGGDRT